MKKDFHSLHTLRLSLLGICAPRMYRKHNDRGDWYGFPTISAGMVEPQNNSVPLRQEWIFNDA